MTEFNNDKIATNVQLDSTEPINAEIMAELRKLKEEKNTIEAELNAQKAENSKLQRGIVEAPQRAGEGGAVSDIIHGFPDMFKKDYSFNMGEDKSPLVFTVEAKPATALDMAKMASLVVDLSDGQSNYMNGVTVNILNALATLKVVGTKVPDWLVDESKLYRVDILLKVYSDYQEWIDTFRVQQEH